MPARKWPKRRNAVLHKINRTAERQRRDDISLGQGGSAGNPTGSAGEFGPIILARYTATPDALIGAWRMNDILAGDTSLITTSTGSPTDPLNTFVASSAGIWELTVQAYIYGGSGSDIFQLLTYNPDEGIGVTGPNDRSLDFVLDLGDIYTPNVTGEYVMAAAEKLTLQFATGGGGVKFAQNSPESSIQPPVVCWRQIASV